MPLVVPVLRFFVVFLNVYETFKTLKPPPPSARRGGQPSVRAVTQRKRDLKGCLSVWVVWCCFAIYERTFDRILGVFLPFYSEIKSVFLFFLVLTRAKGAEPLFLHVLRPLIKPYAAVLDPILELSRDIGDFLLAILQIPLDYFFSSPWFLSWWIGKPKSAGESSSNLVGVAGSESSARTSNHSCIPIFADHDGTTRPSRVPNKRHRSIRNVYGSSVNNPADARGSIDRHSKYASTTSLPAYSEHPPHDPPRYSQTLPGLNGHQVRHPPAPISGHDGPASTLDLLSTASEYHSPEWRTYPAFPSAYPPTPLPASTSLPGSATTWSRDDHPFSGSAYPPIPEGARNFCETHKRGREPRLGVVCGSGTNKTPPRACHYEGTGQPDEDTLLDDSMCSSEAGLSEDDFGVSLRTPHRSPQAIPSSAYSSANSLTSALTTTGHPTLLCTNASSDSLSSGTSSLAGRKRAHEAFQGKARSTLPATHSRNATLRGRPTPPPIHDPPQTSTSGDEDDSEIGDNDGNAQAKRQRVLDPLWLKSTVRPTTRGMNNARKGVLPSRITTSRSCTVTTVPQGTTRVRAGSSMVTNSTIRGRKPTAATRQVGSHSHAVVRSSSTSSSQSGTLRARP